MISDEEFEEQVNADVRGTKISVLRYPENLDTWLYHLLQLKRSCETQLSEDKAIRSEEKAKGTVTDEWLAHKDRWRASTIRFKNGVENRIAECKELKRQNKNYLYQAIVDHRDSIYNDDDPENADVILWEKAGLE